MTSGRVGICTGLTRRPLVVPLRDQFQHILYTVNLIVMTVMKMKIGLDTVKMTQAKKMSSTPFVISHDIIGEWS